VCVFVGAFVFFLQLALFSHLFLLCNHKYIEFILFIKSEVQFHQFLPSLSSQVDRLAQLHNEFCERLEVCEKRLKEVCVCVCVCVFVFVWPCFCANML